MSGNYAVFVTDDRQAHLSRYLMGKVKSLDWRKGIKDEEAKEVAGRCSYLVLPTPVSKLKRNQEVLDLLKDKLIKEKSEVRLVIGGAMNSALGEELKSTINKNNMEYFDLMEDETVCHKNARITAEATLAEILRYSDYSIRCQKILVCGYGRCGREIANLLAAVGAKVTVLARSRESRRLARAEGHEAADFCYGPEEVYGAKTIVNTVPATVIREPMLVAMQKDAVIIDIASRPGGVDLMAAERCGAKVVVALGLPGIYTTKSSAKILADAITERTADEKAEREGRSWIYQISI